MSSPAAIRGREVRQRLLVAAAELVPERGWTAVSTRVLAERAGVTPSVVHYHFPSVRALLNEAVLNSLRQVIDGVDTLLDNTKAPADLVDGLLASVDQYTGTDRSSLLFVESYLAATRDEELRREIADLIDGLRRRLGGWMELHGVSAPHETAAVVLAAVDGRLLHRGLGAAADRERVSAVLRRLVN